MHCRYHPRYKAKLKPRIPCEACWWLYFRMHAWWRVPVGVKVEETK